MVTAGPSIPTHSLTSPKPEIQQTDSEAASVDSIRPEIPYAARPANDAAKRLMQRSNWREEHTAKSESFLDNYYAKSRLHMLSTWKAEMKSLMAEAQRRSSVSEIPMLDQKNALNTAPPRIIMHADFDSFFASVGLSQPGREHLRSQPVAVCHSDGGITSTSEIASCNYVCRGYGVRNGMRSGILIFCPSQ